MAAPTDVVTRLLGQLRAATVRVDRDVADRDRIIRSLRSAGVPLRRIASTAGLSHTRIAQIAAPDRPVRID